jgi:integrase
MSKLFLSETKISKLLDLARPDSRDFALFHTALATGFRAGDLLSLKRWDVAPTGDVISFIRIKMQKTGKTVERQLPRACREAIHSYLITRADNNPFLFCAQSNNTQNREGPMNRSSLQRLYKFYLSLMFSREELRGNACHVTRRSMAQIISQRSGRVEPATRFLGHTSIATTIKYLDADKFGREADEIVSTLEWNQSTS